MVKGMIAAIIGLLLLIVWARGSVTWHTTRRMVAH